MNFPFVYFKLVFVVLFGLVTTLCGCGGGVHDMNNGIEAPTPTPRPPEQPDDPETSMRIRQDYRDYLVDKGMESLPVEFIWLREHFGTYNGYTVVLMKAGYGSAAVVVDVVIDGILFRYNDPTYSIIAWKDGQIFELHEARDLGMLTREDLMDIADRHNGNQDSRDGSLAGLSIGVENRIKDDYFNYLSHTFMLKDMTVDDVWIEVYYGTYMMNNDDSVVGASGLVTVMADFEGSDYICEERGIVIDGIPFHYNSGNSIIAWRPNRVFLLKDAYDFGLLTKEDLVNIADRLTKQPIGCHN